MAVGRQTYLNDGAKSTTTQTPSRLVMADGNVYKGNIGAGTSGRTKHLVTGTAQPIEKTNKSIGQSVGGTQRQAEAKQILSGLKTTDNTPRTTYVNDNSGSGGGGVDVGGSYHNETEDIITMIKNLLNQQKEQADAYYKSLYEQTTAKNKQVFGDNRDQINVNFKRGERYLNNLYGNGISGQGLSNRARNYQNWQSNLAENQRNYANNDATALSQYNMNKANTASQLAQGWYNYVLPVYTNRQQTLDDYDYRKYLATL